MVVCCVQIKGTVKFKFSAIYQTGYTSGSAVSRVKELKLAVNALSNSGACLLSLDEVWLALGNPSCMACSGQPIL